MCSRLQGGLLGFLANFNIRQWNPLQQLQAMQALQTFVSLGLINQFGQQGGMQMLNGHVQQQVGQGTMAPNMSQQLAMVGMSQAPIHSSNTHEQL
jgi:hypothetical protein